jgi:hypothetical protein
MKYKTFRDKVNLGITVLLIIRFLYAVANAVGINRIVGGTILREME